MKYKTALAAVFAKYRNPRTRSHAVSLLERYASKTRPVTAWHALGEDAAAARLLLEGLGFRETEHFTVQTSVLDPGATRYSWTDSGLALVAAMAAELSSWDGSLVQRRVLAPNSGDPLELVRDEEDAARGRDAGGGFCEEVLAATRRVAELVLEFAGSPLTGTAVDPATREHAVAWAQCQGEGSDDCDKTPVAPLAVLEALARMRGADWMPDFQVFDAFDARSARCGWQASRPMRRTDVMPIAGSVNLIPLCDQIGPGGQLDRFLAWNAADWKKFPGDRDVAWTQFDARLRRTAEALQFALDAPRMRDFVVNVVEAAYEGFSCAVSSTTRLAVGNTALGGAPGNEDLEDDNGDPTELLRRIEDSAFPAETPVYMGAHMLTHHDVYNLPWTATPTSPVPIATGDPDADSGDFGLRASEIAHEWFLIVHGDAGGWDHSNQAWRPANARRKLMESNLREFRRFASSLGGNVSMTTSACAPTNPEFDVRGDDNEFTAHGAFVNGVAAAMRKYSNGALEFVDNSPWFPEKIFAGVWSGIATDLAPANPAEAGAADVFPNLGSFAFRGYEGVPAGPEQATADAFLDLVHLHPLVQFRYGKRTAGVPRRHMVVIETNVKAEPFVKAVSTPDGSGPFVRALWRAFFMSFAMRKQTPLLALDDTFADFQNAGLSLSGFPDWVARECPGWAAQLNVSRYGSEPCPGFTAGWLEDSRGRLVLVVSSDNSDLSLRVKAAWRYSAALPVPSASYFAKEGRTTAVPLTDGMSDSDRFRAVLRAAMGQSGFVHSCVTTRGLNGAFGTAWIRSAVEDWDLDSDAYPARDWYLGSDRALHVNACVR